jgi:peptidoglycan/xylan/chitin deacetylase (PgdA/CDA1 family)
MMRTRIKVQLARAVSAVGATRAVARWTGTAGAPLVIGYHRVVDDVRRVESPAITPMLTSTRMFEQQLDWIARRYRFASLDELAVDFTEDRRRDVPLAAVTFDDGYADVYEHAFPLLMRKGIPAAVFIVSEWIGTSTMLTHDRLFRLLALRWPASLDVLVRRGLVRGAAPRPRSPFEALRWLLESRTLAELTRLCAALEDALDLREETPASLRPLTWDMVSSMHRVGITIGAHTRRHAVLTQETPIDVAAEVAASRSALRRRLTDDVRHFAYPDGAYDPHTLDAVEAAGYTFAYTACRHVDRARRRLTIPRRLLWENSARDGHARFAPAVMRCLTSGVFDLRTVCYRTHQDPGAALQGREATAPRLSCE